VSDIAIFAPHQTLGKVLERGDPEVPVATANPKQAHVQYVRLPFPRSSQAVKAYHCLLEQ
jgi:hypothetical protein